MTAFDFIERVQRSGGSVRLVNGEVFVRGFPDELEIAVRNRAAIREAVLNPGQWPCRQFQLHPTTPTLPCRTCGEHWKTHPPSLSQLYARAPLLDEARAIVAAATVTSRSESTA